jgi:hypothetical protein
MTLKERFEFEVSITPKSEFKVLVTLVKLPTGAIEVITNTQFLESKIDYLCYAYDGDFKLNNNKVVEIVGYVIY